MTKDKESNKNKKNNLLFMLLVIVLISLILCISSFGIATWARYRSVTGSNVEAQIAKWSFKVNGEEEQFADIDLADTIDFTHVTTDKIAPGTYGSFDLDIDGRGSEVSLDYYIDMVVANKPTNMKFYLDSNYSQPIEIAVGNKMFLEGDLLLSENPMQEIRTIYWKWEYRTSTMPSTAVLNAYSSVIPGLETLISEYDSATGAAQEEIVMKINDKIDTQEAGGQVIVNVKVKGVQISPNFSLKRVQVTSSKDDIYETGDTVNFSMEFTENVYGDNNQGLVTNANAPVVTVGFGTATANSPIAKVASLMQTNLKLSEGENLAIFVSASENKINYSYTLKSGDKGAFRIASIIGKAYNRDGKEINFTGVQSVPEVIGGTITTEVPIQNPTTVNKKIILGNPVKNSDGTWVFPNAVVNNLNGENIKYIILQFASGIQLQDRLVVNGIDNVTVNNDNTVISINVEGKNKEEIESIIRNNFKVSLVQRNSPEEISIKVSVNDNLIQNALNYYSGTGHFYEFVSSPGISWENAKIAAEERTYMGLKGYLATITSEGEDNFSKSLIKGYGWLGGTCDYQYILDSSGNRIYNSMNESLWNWYWVTGPEAGMKFWDKSGNITEYSKWGSGEPNNNGNEYYLHYYQNNTWNDYANDNSSISGYIVEYGGMLGDDIINQFDSDISTIQIEASSTQNPTLINIGNANVQLRTIY